MWHKKNLLEFLFSLICFVRISIPGSYPLINLWLLLACNPLFLFIFEIVACNPIESEIWSRRGHIKSRNIIINLLFTGI